MVTAVSGEKALHETFARSLQIPTMPFAGGIQKEND